MSSYFYPPKTTGGGGGSGTVTSVGTGFGLTGGPITTSGTISFDPTILAPSIAGTRASPSLITAAGGIAFTGINYLNIKFIAGNAGPVVVTANPQIAAGSLVGQLLTLIGRNSTNYVQLSDGNGLSLNGTKQLLANSALTLMWDGTNWLETAESL